MLIQRNQWSINYNLNINGKNLNKNPNSSFSSLAGDNYDAMMHDIIAFEKTPKCKLQSTLNQLCSVKQCHARALNYKSVIFRYDHHCTIASLEVKVAIAIFIHDLKKVKKSR